MISQNSSLKRNSEGCKRSQEQLYFDLRYSRNNPGAIHKHNISISEALFNGCAMVVLWFCYGSDMLVKEGR